jgi:hypothetical protein
MNQNVAIGYSCGKMSNNSQYNISLGSFCLSSSSANTLNRVIAMGYYTASSLSDDSSDAVIIGNSACQSALTNNSIVIGPFSCQSSAIVYNTVAIGRSANSSGSNNVLIGASTFSDKDDSVVIGAYSKAGAG